MAELVPGGIGKEVVANQARSLRDAIMCVDAAAVERHRQAIELVAGIERLDGALRDPRARITAAVTASTRPSPTMFGVGASVAAKLIGYGGDPTRFATARRYAAHTRLRAGRVLSGGRITHRLSAARRRSERAFGARSTSSSDCHRYAGEDAPESKHVGE